MSPVRVPKRAAAIVCGLVLALPAAISDAGQLDLTTLPVKPMAQALPAKSSLDGLSLDWSAPRYISLTAKAVAAGDRIAELPYIYGGGHGSSFVAAGYDCSGSVSYVLHAMGLLGTPEDSSDLMRFGAPGPGEHVTIYTNPAHAYMVIDGRRFDTAGLSATGSRWQTGPGPGGPYVVRHPAGL